MSKQDDICSLIASTDCDIVALTETWLSSSVTDAEIFPDASGFNIFRKDRTSGRGGGVLIATKESFKCNPVNISTPLEMLWLSCALSHGTVLIGVCYRPPQSDPFFLTHLNDAFNNLYLKYPKSRILFFGDFNYPSIDWSTLPDSTPLDMSEATGFVNFCLNFNLTQLVTEPTRSTSHSSNILDLILVSEPDSLKSINYLREISDHKVINCTFSIHMPSKSKRKKTVRLYDKGNYQTMNAELDKFVDAFLLDFDSRSVCDNWSMFKSKMQQLADIFIPTAAFTESSSAPWFNSSLKHLSSKKKRLYRKAKDSGCNLDWDKFYDIDKQFRSAIRTQKRIFYNTDLPCMLKSNPKKFWRVINPKSDIVITLKNDADTLVPDDECAELLNDAFCSVFTREVGNMFFTAPNAFRLPMAGITFEPAGIINIIENLKISSSAGIDEINVKILKNTKELSSVILAKIFSQSLSTGILPHDWKVGKIVPIYKNGDKSSPLNYRPISLTSVSCKLMEHIIYSKIIHYLTENNFINSSQHGFRKDFSCETQLASFVHDLHVNLDSNIQTDVIFLDFAKAFDKVPHRRLIFKLSQLNLDPSILNWIINFLTHRQQFVTTNQASSSLAEVTSGVPQGSVLGPLLFLIYINDLPLSISSHVRLFADDCVIYHKITNPSDHVLLQDDLLSIQAWCERWQMSLNVQKCKLVSFTRRLNPSVFSYSLNSVPLQRNDSYRYLGVQLSSDLSWATHISHVVSSANQSLGFLKRNLKLAPPSLKLLAYSSLVRPKLEFASAIWDPHQAYLTKNLEAIQNRALRFIYSDYSSFTSVSSLRIRASLPLLSERRKLARLSLFHKFYYSPCLRSSYISSSVPRHRRAAHTLNVARPKTRTVAFQNSLFSRTAIDWNDLPANVVSTPDATEFKKLLLVVVF